MDGVTNRVLGRSAVPEYAVSANRHGGFFQFWPWRPGESLSRSITRSLVDLELDRGAELFVGPFFESDQGLDFDRGWDPTG